MKKKDVKQCAQEILIFVSIMISKAYSMHTKPKMTRSSQQLTLRGFGRLSLSGVYIPVMFQFLINMYYFYQQKNKGKVCIHYGKVGK